LFVDYIWAELTA